MKTLSDMVRHIPKIITDNSPAILTGVGVGGMVTTTILAVKATFKAARMIHFEEDQLRRDSEQHGIFDEPQLDEKQRFELVWKLYIPAASAGILTVATIIFATRIGARRTAAMTAAYALSEKAFEQYRDKIVEKLGERKEEQARDEIAQERVTANPPPDSLAPSTSSVLCMDAYTGRYFLSDMETIKAAENKVNHRILRGDMYVSLTEFYEEVGLERTSMTDDVGWNIDKLLELKFTSTITPRGIPCLVLEFHTMPIRHYEHFH